MLTIVGVALLVAGALQADSARSRFLRRWRRAARRRHLFSLKLAQTQQEAKPIQGAGWWTIARLGFRNATYRPGRTVLCITLIASAAFIIVAVDSFRRSGAAAADRKSGTGGYPLLAESLLPVVHDANTPEGRESLNLNTTTSSLKDLSFVNFRVRPGDDTSCLNLYQPRNPKIVAPPEVFHSRKSFHVSEFTHQRPTKRKQIRGCFWIASLKTERFRSSATQTR